MTTTYLITGGTGLVGKAFIQSLSPDNTAVIVLTRNKAKAKQVLGDNIQFTEQLTLSDIEQSDIVLNLAGEPIADRRWTDRQKHHICQSRWAITRKLVELIKRAESPPTLFISGSAIGMYGRQGAAEIDENHTQYHHEFTHEVCAHWESIALSLTDQTRVAILRTGIVLSNTGGALSKMIPPFKFGVGGKIADGTQIMSWIHIQDMVRAIQYITTHKALCGPINLTAPNAVNNKTFSEILAKQLNRPCLFKSPAWLLTGLFGEMSDILLFGQNVVPSKLQEAGFVFKYPTLKEALSDLI